MTRQELLDLWIDSVSKKRQKATLTALYTAASQAVKDAMVAAMKADLVAIYGAKATVTDSLPTAAAAEAAEVNGVV